MILAPTPLPEPEFLRENKREVAETAEAFAATDFLGLEFQYTVTTRERFTAQRDPAGVRLSQPAHVTVEYSHDVVPHDDGWAVLWWYERDACAYWSPVLTTQRGPECEHSEGESS